MKRLQFRHNNEVFQNRADVLKYFADIVNSTNTASFNHLFMPNL